MSEKENRPDEGTSGREIVISRVFDAPRELVWHAWTEPRHVGQWWGPRGFTTTTEIMDVRPGGTWKHVMRGPDGTEYPNKSIFKEVVKPERIVFSHAGGRKGGPGASFVATWSFDVVEEGKTRVTIHMVFPTAAERELVVREFGAIEGGQQTLERLAEHLPTMRAESASAGREMLISRVFDAPRELVWDAWTDGSHVGNWWGPNGFTTTTHARDFRPGGAWRFTMHGPDGTDYPNEIVYAEIARPERLAYAHGRGDGQPAEFDTTVTFADEGGKTRVTLRAVFASVERFEAAMKFGAVEGGNQTMARFAAHLVRAPVVVERTFAASVDRVWQAITDKDQMKRWYFDLKEFRPEPGFAFDFTVEHGGARYVHLCRITEVIPRKKLAYTWRYEGHPGDSLVTFELQAEGGRTRLRLTHEGLETFPTLAAFAKGNFLEGWTELLGSSLPKFLEGDGSDREIVSTRVFDAPRERVWRAFADPQLVVTWWGPDGFTNTLEKMELRPGGTWKHVMHGPDGTDYPNESVFTEVVEPERIVFHHLGPMHDFTMKMTFADEGGKTRLTWRMWHDTAEACAKVRGFAPAAIEQNFDRLAACLGDMQKR